MGVEIQEDGVVPAATVVDAPKPATTAPVPGVMKIDSIDRPTFTATVDGKVVIYTAGLSFDEEWEVERGLDQRDMGSPGTMRAMALATVRSIDGALVPFAANPVLCADVVKRLGDRGAKFVYRQYIANIGKTEDVVKN